mgnify:CR=1 FL=1
MPFYLTNENIEATMERNPDDVFNPSGINNDPTSRDISISNIITQAIIDTFETEIKKEVIVNECFSKIDTFKERIAVSYIFSFETHNDEYEIRYYMPLVLVNVLEDKVKQTKEFFLNLSNKIISSLNEEEFSFLEDIELTNLTQQDIETKKSLTDLYLLNLSIDNKEYGFYLQLDKQFNKIF